jgi:hypothetical protein
MALPSFSLLHSLGPLHMYFTPCVNFCGLLFVGSLFICSSMVAQGIDGRCCKAGCRWHTRCRLEHVSETELKNESLQRADFNLYCLDATGRESDEVVKVDV